MYKRFTPVQVRRIPFSGTSQRCAKMAHLLFRLQDLLFYFLLFVKREVARFAHAEWKGGINRVKWKDVTACWKSRMIFSIHFVFMPLLLIVCHFRMIPVGWLLRSAVWWNTCRGFCVMMWFFFFLTWVVNQLSAYAWRDTRCHAQWGSILPECKITSGFLVITLHLL